MQYYISIEKDIEVFELFKKMWRELGVEGLRADSMAEGIIQANKIENDKEHELYFIDIVAGQIDYLPQLNLLSEQTAAPILVVTNNYDENEHYEAMMNGADHYGAYLEGAEPNIQAVIACINSIERRSAKNKSNKKLLTHGNIIILNKINKVLSPDNEVQLSKIEMELLHCLIVKRGITVTYDQLKQHIWPEDPELFPDILYSSIKRLRGKLRALTEDAIIENVRDIGYRINHPE